MKRFYPVGIALLMASGWANALSVDFGTVVTDVGTIATAVVAVLVAIKGAQFVFGLIKRS